MNKYRFLRVAGRMARFLEKYGCWIGREMKIIKQGKLPENRIHKTTCDKCGTVFEFEEKESQVRSFPRNESARIVKCPFCGKDVWMDL
jgi:uncharacterized protein with PIN domain